MKRTLLISSISLLLSANLSNAQTKIGIGIKAGLNYSNLSRGAENNSMYSIDQRKSFAGYHFGGYVEFRFLKWSMQPELIYSQQGQNFAFGNLGGQETRINYVNIPLLIKYYIVQGLNVQAGPQVGFVVNAKGDVYNTRTNQVFNQSITGLLKSSDFALSLGIGYDLPMGLTLNARYNLGLTDISKYSGKILPSGVIPFGGWAPIGTVPTKNQVVQVSVGYRLKSLGLK